MGNRVRITLTEDGSTFTPSLYLHWGGSSALALCQKACNAMSSRGADAAYALARLTALACEAAPGNTSVGIMAAPADRDEAESEGYSHGDAGTWIVTLTGSEWRIQCFNGRTSEGAFQRPKTLRPAPAEVGFHREGCPDIDGGPSPHFDLGAFKARVMRDAYGYLSVADLKALAANARLEQVLIRWHEGRALVAAQDAAALIAACSWCVRDVSLPAKGGV